MLRDFHVNVFALPSRLGPCAATAEGFNAILREPDGRPPTFDEPLRASFDEAYDALVKLPRLDAEPDGFFVIAGDHDGRRWQIDGHLFDFGGRLHRVELHGSCPWEALAAMLACWGWPLAPLAFELVREGVALDEAGFRAWLATEAG